MTSEKERKLVFPDYLPGGRDGSIVLDLLTVHLLRSDFDPWADSHDIAMLHLHRGAFISAWANIETIITELCIRASRLEQYAALRAKFPYARTDKAKFLRNAIKVDGPLKPYSTWIELILIRIERLNGFRDMIVHSRMKNPSAFTTRFDRWDVTADSRLTHFSDQLTFAELKSQANRICRLSRLITRCYARYINEDVLPSRQYFNPPKIPPAAAG